MKFLKVFFGLSLMVAINVGAASLQGLNLFRTYYLVQLMSPMAEQFDVWIKENEAWWVQRYVSVNNAEEISHLTAEQLQRTGITYAGMPNPPKSSVPSQFHTYETGLRKRLQVLIPDLEEVHLVYLGHFARVNVTEIVPHLLEGEGLGTRAESSFEVRDDQVTSVLFGSTGFKKLVTPRTQNGALLDFSLPAALEGSSVLFTKDLGQGLSEHDRAREALLQALYTYAKDPYPTGSQRESEIRKALLARQGSSPFPPQFKQNLELQVKVQRRAKEIVFDSIKLRFSTTDFVLGRTTVERRGEKTGITVRISGGLDQPLELLARDDRGNESKIAFQIKTGQRPELHKEKWRRRVGSVEIPAVASKRFHGKENRKFFAWQEPSWPRGGLAQSDPTNLRF